MKKFKVFIPALALTLSLGAFSVQANAEEATTGLGGVLQTGLKAAAPVELQGADDLNKVIASLISSVIGFLGVVLLVYLLYGGFLYMTAAGDATQVKKAVDVIRSAIIGLVIIASAYAIATQVIKALVTATSGPTSE